MGKVFYVKGKSAGTSHNAALHKLSDKVNMKYLYYYLKTIKSRIMDLAKYTTGLGVISQGDLINIQIPLPSLERQEEIVQAIDIWTNLAQQEESTLKMLEQQMMFEVKEMGRGKSRVKLGDVCDIESGTYITKKTATEGVYPVYGGGDKSCLISEYNRESKFVIAKDGVSENCVRYVSGKFFLNHHGWTFKNKENTIYPYIGYWLLNNQELLYQQATGTAQKGINQVSFYELQISLPTIAEQQTLQPHFDEIRHKHAKIAEYKAKAQDAIGKFIPSY
jgi:restriction endonuclease S subunit